MIRKWSYHRAKNHSKYVRQTSRAFAKGKVPMNLKLMQMAKEGYDAYGEMAKWKNFQGADMPQWDALPDEIQERLCSAAHAIVKKYVDNFKSYVLPNERRDL